MGAAPFDSIINFAIEREKEAVQFYKDLQSRVKFQERQNFLKTLENMGRQHIEVLENIRTQDIESLEIREVHDLSLSDFLVEAETTENMSYQDILITGMKKEQSAIDLYTRLADEVPGSQMKKVFQKLVSEEAKHKNFFETIYDEEVLTEN